MPNYVYFLLAVAGLIVGYIIYGSIVAKIFGADENRPTPAKTMADGVDYVEMPVWKVWLIQLLNIAGVGPVFGPILGALYGPSAPLPDIATTMHVAAPWRQLLSSSISAKSMTVLSSAISMAT